MTRVLRGQQGFPTGPERRAAGPADDDVVSALPSAEDWEDPEQAEHDAAVARDALARSHGRGAPVAANEQTDLVREAEQIEEEVAPGRAAGGGEPPTEESAND